MTPLAAVALVLLAATGEVPVENLEYCFKGVVAQRAGDHGLAVEQISRCIENGSLETPNLVVAHYNRGYAHAAAGDHEKAARDYDEAIRLDPAYAPAYNGRCWSRALLRKPQGALADCDESLRLAPDLPTTLDSRALAYWLLGRQDEARRDLEQARHLDPALPDWEERFREFEAMMED
jgi:tetratricopeptide (TPR) repeat protein